MAAAPGGGGGGDGKGLFATYAAFQSNLRKQFYGDLVDLRGALLNTMSVAPHRASSLHVKMHLIDSALNMLEESKESVSNAEMSQLMNMSAKVARAVEAWRVRKVQPGSAPRAAQVSGSFDRQQQGSAATGSGGGSVGAQLASPFAAAEVQAGEGGEGAGGAPLDADRFAFLSTLVAGPPSDERLRTGKSLPIPLPDIDWDVPEIKPSGNLDAMLRSEALKGAEEQARRSATVTAGAGPPPRPLLSRITSAEALLGRMAAQAAESGGGGLGESVCQQQQQQCRSGGGRGSPLSAGTSCQQPEGSANSGGGQAPAGSGGGSVGNAAGGGSACPSPSAGALQQAQHAGQAQHGVPVSPFSVAVQHASPPVGHELGIAEFGSMQAVPFPSPFSGHAAAAPPQQAQHGVPVSPFSVAVQHASPPVGHELGIAGFGSMQAVLSKSQSLFPSPFSGHAAAAPPQQAQQAQHGLASHGSYGGTSAQHTPINCGGSGGFSFGAPGLPSMQYDSATLTGMQHMGLLDGSTRAPSPPLSAAVSFSRQQAAAAAAAATQQQQQQQQQQLAQQQQQLAQQAARLSALQHFPHAALHAGSAGLASLLGGADNSSYQLQPAFGGSGGGGGGGYQQYTAVPLQLPLGNLVSAGSGAAAGFTAAPSAKGGAMPGLTITRQTVTTGSLPVIRIASGGGLGAGAKGGQAPISLQDGPFGGHAGGSRHHVRSVSSGGKAVSAGSGGGLPRQKRKKT